MKKLIILLESACIVFLLVIILSGKYNPLPVEKEPPVVVVKDMVKDALSLLKSADAEKSNKGAEQILEIKRTIEKELYNIVIDEKVTYCFPLDAKPAKLNALRLFGDFRSQQAIEVLYDNMLYGVGEECDEPGVPSPFPPAVRSLIAIGKPSTDWMLYKWKGKFGLMNDDFGKISYQLPTRTEYGDSNDPKINVVDSIYNEESFPDVYALLRLIISGVYRTDSTKYFVQEVLDTYSIGKDRENVIKNMKEMLLMHD